MRELIRRPSVIAAIAALLFLFPAGAQTVDPDPSAPDAQQQAEYLFIGAMLGMTPPPTGWNCWLETYQPNPDLFFFLQDVHCEPDPALVEQQEQESQQWLDRLTRNGKRVWSELRRRR